MMGSRRCRRGGVAGAWRVEGLSLEGAVRFWRAQASWLWVAGRLVCRREGLG